MRSLALLRGVNVGGNRKVPMKDLTRWLEDAGFTAVTTHIQSGNVVLEHSSRVTVASLVRRTIAEHTGWDVPVLVRSAAQISDVVAHNPYESAAPTSLHVAFLAAPPEPAVVAGVDPRQWLPEEFTIHGSEIYLYLPDGAGRSVMMPRLRLIKDATARNWNTVLALHAMLEGAT